MREPTSKELERLMIRMGSIMRTTEIIKERCAVEEGSRSETLEIKFAEEEARILRLEDQRDHYKKLWKGGPIITLAPDSIRSDKLPLYNNEEQIDDIDDLIHALGKVVYKTIKAGYGRINFLDLTSDD